MCWLVCVGACTASPPDQGPGDTAVVAADAGLDGVHQEDQADAVSDSMTLADARPDVPEDIPSDPEIDPADAMTTDAQDASEDDTVDAAEGAAVWEPGCFFEVDSGLDTRRYDFGQVEATYDRIETSFTLHMGPWREELFDRQVLTHIFFGLFRNAPRSRERYILGAAAQLRPARPAGTRQAVFFARVDLEPRPDGEGYTAYTSVRSDHPWEPGTTYRVHAVLDVVGHTQHLTLTPQGGAPLQMQADIPYFTRDLTSAGWWLELGATDTDHRDVNVVGWTFCDLEILTQ